MEYRDDAFMRRPCFEGRSYRRFFARAPFCLLTVMALCVSRPEALEAATVADFNYVLGTQTIGASYHFTAQDATVESAQAISDMGSTLIKSRGVESNEPILAMPFKTYFSWYGNENWRDGMSAAEKKATYDGIYAKTKSLLTRFNGTGKVFMLGLWEGDWQLMGLTKTSGPHEPSVTNVQGMIDWINERQQGIEDARRDTPHQGVDVFQYLEVNRVRDALILGKQRVVNAVLPFTKVDFVSYSSYDVMRLDQDSVNATLDYIAAKLPAKAGLPEKRVFVGEFGIPASQAGDDPIRHEKANRDIMIKFLKWGCPYVLYWEMYNNEINNGKQVGYWLIDDKNVKQPLYFTLQRYLAAGKAFVTTQQAQTGTLPSLKEFQAWAVAWLMAYDPALALILPTKRDPPAAGVSGPMAVPGSPFMLYAPPLSPGEISSHLYRVDGLLAR